MWEVVGYTQGIQDIRRAILDRAVDRQSEPEVRCEKGGGGAQEVHA